MVPESPADRIRKRKRLSQYHHPHGAAGSPAERDEGAGAAIGKSRRRDGASAGSGGAPLGVGYAAGEGVVGGAEEDEEEEEEEAERRFRNLYKEGVDFAALGREDPEFAAFLRYSAARGGDGGDRDEAEEREGERQGAASTAKAGARTWAHLDFADPAAAAQLTRALLRRDFGARGIELPPDRLCPPVPNRHCYILWLKELLDSTAPSSEPPCRSPFSVSSSPSPSGVGERESSGGRGEIRRGGRRRRKVLGLDIGTGASLIYPLLGCAQRAGWHFAATDVDAASLACARRNAALNGLLGEEGEEPRVRILDRSLPASSSSPSSSSLPLIPSPEELGWKMGAGGAGAGARLDFAMVNPPFYASAAEVAELAALKGGERPAGAAPPCTGAPHEMVCEGGEVGFVARLLEESIALVRGGPGVSDDDDADRHDDDNNHNANEGEKRGEEEKGGSSRERHRQKTEYYRDCWFTAMLGRASSVEAVTRLLRDRGVTNCALASLSAPGARTRRWAVGWCLGDRRPSRAASRWCCVGPGRDGGEGEGGGTEDMLLPANIGRWVLPPATEMTVASFSSPTPVASSDGGRGQGGISDKAAAVRRRWRDALCALAADLDLLGWEWDDARGRGVGSAPGNVWGRAYRRRKAREAAAGGEEGGMMAGTTTKTTTTTTASAAAARPPLFGFALTIDNSRAAEVSSVVVVARWLRGDDFAVFESFAGLLRKTLSTPHLAK